MTPNEKLLAAIGEIDDDLILEADDERRRILSLPRRTHSPWKKAMITAACFLFCFAAWQFAGGLFRTKGAEQNASASLELKNDLTVAEAEESAETESWEEAPAEAQSSEALNDGKENQANGGQLEKTGGSMHYAAPLLPLNVEGDSQGISAERELYVNAEDYYRESEGKLYISDKYLLTNTTEEEKTLLISYPYGTSVSSGEEVKMSADGSDEGQKLCFSQPISGFSEEGMNLEYAADWEDYSTALNGQTDAVNENIPIYEGYETVTVYEFTDLQVPENCPEAATLSMEFRCPEDTVIFIDLNGVSMDGEQRIYDVFVKELERGSMSGSIWVFGGNELDITVKGYTDGSNTTVLPGLSANIKKTELPLSEAVQRVVEEFLQKNPLEDSRISSDHIAAAVLQQLNYSQIGNDPQSRYDVLSIQMLIQDTLSAQRIFTLTQEVTIPANGSTEILVTSEKRPSYGYESRRMGIDIATTLGSSLCFDRQTLTLRQPEEGTLTDSNLDLPQQEESVELDLSTVYYYANFDRILTCDGLPLAKDDLK